MSITLHTETESSLTVERAILFYKGSRGGAFATENEVRDGTIMPGRPVDITRLVRQLTSSHDGAKQHVTLLHPRALVDQPGLLVWWAPDGMRPLMFSKGGAKHVWLPPLLFMVRDQKMSVFGLSQNERPMTYAELYFAPLMNCYANGSVCMGSMPAGTTVDEWEDSFFNSRFTHMHHAPRGYVKLSKTEESYNPFGTLAKTGKTLSEMLIQIA